MEISLEEVVIGSVYKKMGWQRGMGGGFRQEWQPQPGSHSGGLREPQRGRVCRVVYFCVDQ